jgi:hypothetical protein
MSDVVYRPNESANPEPPPASAPPSSRESIPDAIDTGSEAENIRQATRETVKKRREANYEIEDAAREPVKIHYEDDRTFSGYKGFKEAVKDQSDRHKTEHPDFQFAVKTTGKTPQEMLERLKDIEFLKTSGLSHEEAVQYSRTLEMPPQRIGLIKTDGYQNQELREPLGDRPASLSADEALTPRQAAREQATFRQALAAEQERLRAEVASAEERIEQQHAQELQEQLKAAAQADADQQAEAQRQQALQQRQADDAERVRVAQLEWQHNATNEERKLVDTWNKWEQWAKQTPEMMSFDALKLTQQTNPQRWAQLQKHMQTALQTKGAIEARLREIGETKQLRQHAVATQQQQAAQAAYRQYAESEDAKALEMISQELPQYKTPEGKRAIGRQGRALLKNLGLTDQHIAQVWDNGAPINLRSAPAQAILAKAAAYDLAVARAREVQKAGVPPVQRPGVARPRSAGAAENVRALQAQLENAKGNQSLKIAAQLIRAQRAAGML